MSDHYVKVKFQLERMNSADNEGEEEAAAAEKEEVAVLSSSPGSAASPVRGKAVRTSVPCRRRRSKSLSKKGSPDHACSPVVKQEASKLPQETMETTGTTAEGKIMIDRNSGENILHIKGTGKVLQGKMETNGVVVTNHRSKDQHVKEDGNKLTKKKRPVTVDSSKAKTSLEALRVSIRQLKWKECPGCRRVTCDIYWHGVSFHDNDNIVSGQVNKFPGMIEMLRKVNLSRAVRTMQELFPEEYNFYPRSWILPDEYQLFAAQVRLAKDDDSSLKPTFIVKPDGGSQGDGIYLIRDPSDLRTILGAQSKHAVVQEYIQKPLLIDKLKFDIRLYVLIKSLQPLEIYIAKEGLSRFCTEPYQEPSQKNLNQVFMHLTNYSLNVQSGNFVHSDSTNTGSKRTFSSILYRLASKGVDIKKVWSDIISLVIKTVIALVPELKVYYQADIPPGKPGPTCFQILGFDILLMKNLKPVLLEVNANPSMRIEHEQEVSPGVFEYVPSPVDREVKVGVIRDTLRLVDPAQRKSPHPSSLPLGNGSELQDDILEVGSPDKAESGDGDHVGHTLPSLCLKQVFPKYTKQFNYLRMVERIAALFVRFLGVKATMRLGPTGFRTFIRNCKLSSASLSMASVDILYIDITRRWTGMASDSREAGMALQAFIEAFSFLAQRRFRTVLSLRDQVLSLLELCEAQLLAGEERRALAIKAPGERRTAQGPAQPPAPPPAQAPPSASPPLQAPPPPGSPPAVPKPSDCRPLQALRPSRPGNTEN